MTSHPHTLAVGPAALPLLLQVWDAGTDLGGPPSWQHRFTAPGRALIPAAAVPPSAAGARLQATYCHGGAEPLVLREPCDDPGWPAVPAGSRLL